MSLQRPMQFPFDAIKAILFSVNAIKLVFISGMAAMLTIKSAKHALYRPNGHCSHTFDEATFWYLPMGHWWQLDVLYVSLNCPGSQYAHASTAAWVMRLNRISCHSPGTHVMPQSQHCNLRVGINCQHLSGSTYGSGGGTLQTVSPMRY